MWGGSGIIDSTGVNRYFRDARTNMIAEGASEMHYDLIAASVLDQPSSMESS
jgi:butyryl-CoA dehydrogenase